MEFTNVLYPSHWTNKEANSNNNKTSSREGVGNRYPGCYNILLKTSNFRKKNYETFKEQESVTYAKEEKTGNRNCLWSKIVIWIHMKKQVAVVKVIVQLWDSISAYFFSHVLLIDLKATIKQYIHKILLLNL